MTTATTEWLKFDETSWLTRGDEVRICKYASKGIANKVGIVDRKLTKNIAVVIGGKTWRMPPSMIVEYRRGDADNVPQAKQEVVKCNPDGFDDCKVGDVVLIWRGKFEVVKIKALSHKVSCTTMDGRSVGRSYLYKREWFVQKLNNSCFSS